MNETLLNIVAENEVGRIDNERANYRRSDAWIDAVNRAKKNLEDGSSHALRNGELAVQSASGGGIYFATRDTCTCDAYTKGEHQPCWHRAAWTLTNKADRISKIFAE